MAALISSACEDSLMNLTDVQKLEMKLEALAQSQLRAPAARSPAQLPKPPKAATDDAPGKFYELRRRMVADSGEYEQPDGSPYYSRQAAVSNPRNFDGYREVSSVAQYVKHTAGGDDDSDPYSN
jgi:hypothetical protein